MPSAAVRDEGALQMRPAPRGYSSAHIFEPILFFLCQKEKNGFELPRKERGLSAYRCPEFDSKNLSHQLSVAPDSTTRKVSALCASPFGTAAQQNRHFRADRVVRPYKTYPQDVACPPSSRSRAARRQKKPAAFRFRRDGESSIVAGSFFLSKL